MNDFFVGGATENFLEGALKEGSGERNFFKKVGDANAGAGIFANETNGGGDAGIVHFENIGALAGRDAERGDEHGAGFAAAGLHHFFEGARGFVSGARGVGDDAGERGFAEVAEDFVIVLANDGDFVGNAEVCVTAGFEEHLTADIVAGHHAERLRLGAEPIGQAFALALPIILIIAGNGEGVAGERAIFQEGSKVFAVTGGPLEAGVTEIAEETKAAFEEVFGGERRDGSAIADDDREFGSKIGGADIDDGKAGFAHGEFDFAGFNAGDDTVAMPFGEPGRGSIAAALLGEVNGPAGMFVDPGTDASEQAAGIGIGGFDEQGHHAGAGVGWLRHRGKIRVRRKITIKIRKGI